MRCNYATLAFCVLPLTTLSLLIDGARQHCLSKWLCIIKKEKIFAFIPVCVWDVYDMQNLIDFKGISSVSIHCSFNHLIGFLQLASILIPNNRNLSGPLSGGYIQWKPVAYRTADRSITSATYPNVNKSLPSELDEKHFNQAKMSLLYSIVGDAVQHLSTQTTISFGLKKDGFYTANNYTEW